MEEICQDENIGLGCALEHFSEYEEVFSLIDNIKNVYSNTSTSERSYERLFCVLSMYQEQPHLLDSKLDEMLEKLIGMVRCADEPVALKHEAFKYLYIIMKVRGYKTVVRHLPHEVTDIEPVLQLLEHQDPSDRTIWQTRYVLLSWLSIIVMIPFHMSRLDSFNPKDKGMEGRKTVMERILEACKTYVLSDDCFRIAAFLSSRFLTRSDVKEQHLGSFLDWACSVTHTGAVYLVVELTSATLSVLQQMISTEGSQYTQCGSLAAIAAILKHGDREDLLPHAPVLFKRMLDSKYRENNNALFRKLGVKVIQRIGLTFLKARVASWRYKRGCRSLAANLSAGDTITEAVHSSPVEAEEEEEIIEDFDISEEIEEIIEELMQSLRDSDTVIRWSAAKGVGRVTGRLPKELADEVVGSVLELFSPRESDAAWHGGCLALAELGRRGLLLPQRLEEVVLVVLKALVYDEPRGYASVGSHIRDAACYVCWSFARAYDTEVLKPFVKKIAGALLVVSVFDREINCRRAASAAFQENVGRQGTFPHGIEIVTTADYFAVGVKSNAFLNISNYIAQFEEYTLPLINHLVERKVGHWDFAIRELSSKALHNLTSRAPTYMSKTVLKLLLEKTSSIDMNVRHGAVLAIAEIIHALADVGKESGSNIEEIIDMQVLEEVRDLVPTFQQRLQFRGIGGELMKQACCLLIEKCALAVLPFHDLEIIGIWQVLIDDCLSHEVSNIRSKAAAALPALFTEYYKLKPDKDNIRRVNSEKQKAVVEYYINQLSANNQIIRMGFAMAIGYFPKFMLDGQLHLVIPALINASKVTDNTLNWAESRRDSLKALTSICSTVSSKEEGLGPELLGYVDNIYSCFLEGLTEYTMDSRGDIGAWVREASMAGLQVLTSLVHISNSSLLTADLMTKVMAGLAQQAVERIDRTRAQAGKVFTYLLHSHPPLPNIPHYEELLQIFPEEECDKKIIWIAEADTFPRFTELLAFPCYTYNVMLGLIVSIGGLSENLVKHSSSSLFSYMKGIQDNHAELRRLCDTVLIIFNEYQYVDRITVPLFGFLNHLFSYGCIRPILEDPTSTFAADILHHLKLEISKTKTVSKLRSSVEVLCHLVQVKGEVSSQALVQLCIFLCSRFLWVRKTTASMLYEALMLYGEETVIPPTSLEEVMNILSDTNWDQDMSVLKPICKKLCELMKIPVPKRVSATLKAIQDSKMNISGNRNSVAQESSIPSSEEDNGLEARFECPICLQCLSEPVLTSCGHRFCNACIHKWLEKEGGVCPVDNQPLNSNTDLFPDNFTRREIEDLERQTQQGECESCVELVNCCFHDSGCKARIPKNDLRAHLDANLQEHMSMLNNVCSKMSAILQGQKMQAKEQEANNLWEPDSKQQHQNGETQQSCQSLVRSLYERIVLLEQRSREQDIELQNLKKQLVGNIDNLAQDLALRYCSGTYIWTVTQFSTKLKTMASSPSRCMFYSPGFYTAPNGYKFCARLNLSPKDHRHLALHIHLMRTDHDKCLTWPFVGRISFHLVNANDSSRDICDTMMSRPELDAFKCPSKDVNPRGFGYTEFVSVYELTTQGFVTQNDSVLIKIQVQSV